MQQCRLCDKEKPLEISHIVPKFVFRHLKKTSPTGYIRATENPNKPIQDGIKLSFLCGDCEDLFSKWETLFANKIFYPYQNNESQEFEYEEWLTKYLASVSFRVLVYVYEDTGLNYFSPEMLTYVDKAIINLKLYLLGQAEHPKEQRQLLLLLDFLAPNSIKDSPENFNSYIGRAIEIDVLTTDYDSFIYVKYLKFLHLCPIKLSTNIGWRTARINPKKGVLKVQNHELPDCIMNKMQKGASIFTSSQEKISTKQSGIIQSRLESNVQNLIDSEIGQAVIAEKMAK